MNPISLYPGLKDPRCYAIPSDDFDDLTIIAMDPEVGIIGGANNMKEFKADAKKAGWTPVKAPKTPAMSRR